MNRVESDGVFTPVELSILAWEHRAKDPGKCRVCGAELTIGSMGGGAATKYNCSSPEASFIEAAKVDRAAGIDSMWSPRQKAASEHYRASEVLISYHGDPTIKKLVDELRAMREAAGEDMSVAIGTTHFPYGHGGNLCYRFYCHLADDVWEEMVDFEYSHDPSHKEMQSSGVEDDGEEED